MARYLTQFTLQGASLMPADRYVNTMAFETNTAISETHMTIIGTAIDALYDQLDVILAADIVNGYNIKFYDIDAPEPRVPLADVSASSPNWDGGAALPQEVALCLSYRGLTESGDAAGRRRGRIYIGPLGTGALGDGGRPDPAAVTAIGLGVTAFAEELEGTAVNHAVWSRAADNLYDVTNYWVDDAFDTQRRRGLAPTTKTPVGPV